MATYTKLENGGVEWFLSNELCSFQICNAMFGSSKTARLRMSCILCIITLSLHMPHKAAINVVW